MCVTNVARILRALRRKPFLSSALLGAVCALCVSTTAHADTFGSGANQFEIEFVPIGAVGNAADTTGDPNPAGAVDYFYRMGKYEISESMIDAANALTENSDNPLNIAHDARGPNKPATNITWFEAARFVNWLNESEGHSPAYKFDDQNDFQLWEPNDAGYDADNLFRNRRARYFLPSADEWYKAAFYDPVEGVWWDYPNGMNEPPNRTLGGTEPNTAVYAPIAEIPPADVMQAGGLSPFGTMGQAGNVWEMEETEFDLLNDFTIAGRGFRGGGWSAVPSELSSLSRLEGSPLGDGSSTGFRIASIPEPSTGLLLGFFAAVGIFIAVAKQLRRRSLFFCDMR